MITRVAALRLGARDWPVTDRSNSEQAELERERIDEALAQARSLVDSDPASALKQAQVLIRAAPDPRALRIAAAAHRAMGQTVEAELAELAGIKVSFDDPRVMDATEALQQGRRLDAQRITDELLQRQPDDLVALALSAELAIGNRLYDDADRMLAIVRERAPGFLRASLLQANSLRARARVREAIAVLDESLKRDSGNSPALAVLAECYAEVGEIEATVHTYRRLIGVHPSEARPWVLYAQYLRILGRSDESKEAFRKALDLDPAQGAAWWGLAHFFADDLTDQDVRSMERVLIERNASVTDESATRIALAVIADRRRDYSQAFAQLSEGKRLRLESKPYDPSKISTDVDQVIRHFTAELFESRSGLNDASPIFILGMPRSGSTLVERILGRHSQIEGAGELQVLPKLVAQLRFDQGRERSYAKYAATLSSDELAELGKVYVERSRDYRHTSKLRFTDKFNLNCLHVGLIRLILPNARIIDVRRNALDCCWSNFKMLFADGHADDLRHVGQLYRDYVRVLDHVDEAAPGGILRIRYEELVSDLEDGTRQMLEFVGLPFESSCLDFHLSDAPVATPSSEQVRRPINRSSIGSAEPYRQWLGPLIEELGPLADG